MRMRTRVIAVAATIFALFAPASVAAAAEPYDLAVAADLRTVYPYVDGFKDSTLISVDIDGGATGGRIRGSIVITSGKRILTVVPLSSAGHVEFRWNGRNAAGRTVAGTATITLLVDGQASRSTTIAVSSRRVVPMTFTYRQALFDGGGCEDRLFGGGSDPMRTSERLCPLSYGSPVPDYAYMRILGTRSTGGVFAYASFYRYQDRLKQSVFPVKTTITARFVQTGTGTSRIWVVAQDTGGFYFTGDYDPGSNPVVSFSHTSTVKVTGLTKIDWAAHVYDPTWVVSVPETVNLRASFYTVTCTYYKLV